MVLAMAIGSSAVKVTLLISCLSSSAQKDLAGTARAIHRVRRLLQAETSRHVMGAFSSKWQAAQMR